MATPDNEIYNEHFAYCTLVYSKGDMAGSKASHDCVTLKGCRSVSWRELRFEIPRQRYELEKIVRMLEGAYEQGRADRSVEIGKTLKSIISL